MTNYEEERIVESDQGQSRRVMTFKVTQIIWFLFLLLDAAIGLRVVLKLIAANPANPFAAFLYNVTDLFVAPFAGLTGTPAVGGMVLEISSIIAIIVYLLIAWALARIVYLLFYRPRGPITVRQTRIAERDLPQTPSQITQTTTERSTTQTPVGVKQTTVTERTDSQTPDAP